MVVVGTSAADVGATGGVVVLDIGVRRRFRVVQTNAVSLSSGSMSSYKDRLKRGVWDACKGPSLILLHGV